MIAVGLRDIVGRIEWNILAGKDFRHMYQHFAPHAAVRASARLLSKLAS